MNTLYPIIRRVRRPLLPVDAPAALVVTGATPLAALPEAPVAVPEPSPAPAVLEPSPAPAGEESDREKRP